MPASGPFVWYYLSLFANQRHKLVGLAGSSLFATSRCSILAKNWRRLFGFGVKCRPSSLRTAATWFVLIFVSCMRSTNSRLFRRFARNGRSRCTSDRYADCVLLVFDRSCFTLGRLVTAAVAASGSRSARTSPRPVDTLLGARRARTVCWARATLARSRSDFHAAGCVRVRTTTGVCYFISLVFKIFTRKPIKTLLLKH